MTQCTEAAPGPLRSTNVWWAKRCCQSHVEQGLEQGGDRLALGDAVGRDEREPSAVGVREVVGGLDEPAGDVVEVAVVLAAPDVFHVVCLAGLFGVLADEGWVADDPNVRPGIITSRQSRRRALPTWMDSTLFRGSGSGAAPSCCSIARFAWWCTRCSRRCDAGGPPRAQSPRHGRGDRHEFFGEEHRAEKQPLNVPRSADEDVEVELVQFAVGDDEESQHPRRGSMTDLRGELGAQPFQLTRPVLARSNLSRSSSMNSGDGLQDVRLGGGQPPGVRAARSCSSRPGTGSRRQADGGPVEPARVESSLVRLFAVRTGVWMVSPNTPPLTYGTARQRCGRHVLVLVEDSNSHASCAPRSEPVLAGSGFR